MLSLFHWACALTALLTGCVVSTAKEQDASFRRPVLNFLFVEGPDRFHNPEVWAHYFQDDASSSGIRHQIFLHTEEPASYSFPANLRISITKSVSTVKGSFRSTEACTKRAAVVQHMLRETLLLHHSPDDKFLVLSSDSIPVKPFGELYNSIFPSRRVHNPESWFCLFPPSDWEKHAADQNRRLVRHQEWVVLSHAHALASVDQYAAFHGRIRDNYPRVHNCSSTHPKFLQEYWHYYAIFGDVEVNNDDGSAVKQPVQQRRSNCFWYDSSTAPANTQTDGVAVKDGVIVNTTMTWLTALRNQSSFFFARQVGSDAAGASVTVQMPTSATGAVQSSQTTLLDALIQLGVIGSNGSESSKDPVDSDTDSSNGSSTSGGSAPGGASITHAKRNWNFTFDSVDRSEQFKELSGDNTGLRVLVVSVDDRPLNDNIDSGSYVSLTSVLRHHYCKQHNYAYIALRTDNAALLQGIKARYPTELTVADGHFKEAKYGYANFHPGLRQFRASAFGNLPALWYLRERYGEYFDYIWFVDSDAAPNPTQSNRSIGDALREWREHSDSNVYRGVKNPLDATFIFQSNFPWREDLPCSGSFLFKPNRQAEVMLRQWWDYDLPQKNFVDFMEQDTLWYMLEAPLEKYQFEWNYQHTVTLISEPQFTSKFYSINDLWLAHVPNYDPHRIAYFKTM